jgi:hypothetical protein
MIAFCMKECVGGGADEMKNIWGFKITISSWLNLGWIASSSSCVLLLV